MRSLPFYPMIVLTLIGVGGYLGCDSSGLKELPSDFGSVQTASSNTTYPATIPDRSPSTLLIGSFNLQRLGTSKMNDPWVMDKLAHVIQKFDVIALQEITDKDQSALPALVDLVNQVGNGRYAFTVSQRIGRSSYLEQYAFVYDSVRVRSGQEFTYLVQDQQDMLHREPFVGRFQTTGEPAFGFTLINIHTDPDEISTELDTLADVYINVRQYESPEDDVLLLGDLNAAPDRLQRLGQIQGVIPIINGIPTNTKKNKTLDNILFDSRLSREFTGRAGTIDLQSMFSISDSDVARLSDHLPIWAEFSSVESVATYGAMVGSDPTTVR